MRSTLWLSFAKGWRHSSSRGFFALLVVFVAGSRFFEGLFLFRGGVAPCFFWIGFWLPGKVALSGGWATWVGVCAPAERLQHLRVGDGLLSERSSRHSAMGAG